MTNKTYKILIGDKPITGKTYHSVLIEQTFEDMLIQMWALAKQDRPQYASCWCPGAWEPITNYAMFDAEVPEHLEQLVSAAVYVLNHTEIEDLIVDALNAYYKSFARHAHKKDYVEKLVNAAKEWALDCQDYDQK
jgi:hypothetical protein|tara:strand:- start:5683 stop:6087 length:405 start_codon:yes stop_codon:yes gene_type:complete